VPLCVVFMGKVCMVVKVNAYFNCAFAEIEAWLVYTDMLTHTNTRSQSNSCSHLYTCTNSPFQSHLSLSKLSLSILPEVI